jgi:NAD(P)-dependent dehydrogenase (short-subunit alcohol dehydrogenase family)
MRAVFLFISLCCSFIAFHIHSSNDYPVIEADSNSNKVVLVTGANRGIGLAVARKLKADGYTLSLGVRDPSKIPSDLNGLDTHYYEATDAQSAKDWANHVIQQYGHIDAVVHVAGLFKFWEIEADGDEVFDELMDVNAKGTYRLAQATLPFLKQGDSGRFIAFVSIAGKRIRNEKSYGPRVAYAASKHAQLAICKGIQIAGYDFGLRVCAICTSWVNTDMIKPIAPATDPNTMTQPEELAKAVSLLLTLPNTAIVEELVLVNK